MEDQGALVTHTDCPSHPQTELLLQASLLIQPRPTFCPLSPSLFLKKRKRNQEHERGFRGKLEKGPLFCLWREAKVLCKGVLVTAPAKQAGLDQGERKTRDAYRQGPGPRDTEDI